MTDIQLPAYLANRASRNIAAAAAQGLSSGAPPRISIRGNRFTLIDAAGNQKPVQTLYLDAVIVDVNMNVSKMYYDQPYDPNNSDPPPPACWSDNGVAPSAQAPKPQAQTCQGCPLNQWGSETSRLTGKPIKACSDGKKMAILVPGEAMPFLLHIQPGSLTNLGAYVKTIAGQSAGNRPVDVADVVTRFSFVDNKTGVLEFKAVSWVDDATAQHMDKIWAEKATDQLVGKTDLPRQGTLAPPPVSPPAALAPPPAPPVNAAPGNSVAATPPPPAQPAPETPKRRGRTPKVEAAPQANAPFAQNAAAVPATPASPPFMPPSVPSSPATQTPAGGAMTASRTEDPMAIPAFLRRGAPEPGLVAPPAPAVQHGIVAAPPAPDADLMKALQSAMALPVPS